MRRTLTLRRWWRAGLGLKDHNSEHDDDNEHSHDFNGDDDDDNYESVPTFN